MGTYTTEVIRKVYDDTTGQFKEVRPSGDGLDLVELFCGETKACIIFDLDEAKQVAAALIACALELEGRS